MYLLKTPFRTVFVLPPPFVTEYGWLPENKVSSAVDLSERFLGEYTLIGSMTPDKPGDRTHTAIAYAKGSLTKNAAQVIDAVYEQVDYALDREIGNERSASKVITLFRLTTTIFLHVFERLFVGPDLARNEEWMEISSEHSAAAFRAAFALAKYHWLFRPIAARYIPEMRRLHYLNQKLDGYLRPLHQARLQAMKQPDFKPPVDLIQSYIDHAGSYASNTHKFVETMVTVNIAGIQSTGRVLLQALFDLADHPECISSLREEIAMVKAKARRAHGGDDDILNPTFLAELHKMDSFLKESQRFHHANLLSVYRKIITPLRLSNGTVLPANSYVAVPGAIQATNAENGSVFTFQPFQWAEKRAIPGQNERKLGYVFSGPDSLEFGAGSHACPGRFFATNALKVALIRILDRYDFRLPTGTRRPPAIYNHLFEMVQDRNAGLEFSVRGS
ncbi:hypothetical protein Egran_06343 [Elaphomyces granulatus]|uniref:Cytochrome P450 n=1 Tax=Elaphomyces granulatus TaxID=519963 RepID=A0A232LP02_9EURO|nr:hypothetical protein Egran_06343 [Elaphomyces granulatus]